MNIRMTKLSIDFKIEESKPGYLIKKDVKVGLKIQQLPVHSGLKIETCPRDLRKFSAELLNSLKNQI